jgi:DNA repair exonuclease SbcCD ATPase subunit
LAKQFRRSLRVGKSSTGRHCQLAAADFTANITRVSDRGITMASKGPSSLLEVQNRALIKAAKERAAQIEQLEAEVRNLRERAAQAEGLERDLQRLQAHETELQSLQCELQRIRETEAQSRKLERELQARLAGIAERQAKQIEDIERLTAERDFYSKRVLALEDRNRQLTDRATKAEKVGRELTEMAKKYLRWGQKLERELAKIDPDGVPARRLDAQDHA